MTAPTTNEAVRPVAGAHFRHVAAIQMEGSKRKRALALIAAFRDGGQEIVTTGELANRLGWHRAQAHSIASRLRADGYLERVSPRRWRLSQQLLADVEITRQAANR